MTSITRREFLKIGGRMAVAAGLSRFYSDAFAAGLEKLANGLPRVLWMQGQSCSGCSVSLLNADNPDVLETVTGLMSVMYHQTLSAATGEIAVKTVSAIEGGKETFILVIEGSIPVGIPEACMIGGRTFADLILPLIRKATYVVGVGTCAAYGGIPAAEGNLTGALSVKAFMEKHGIKPEGVLVNCPGCPVNPESIVGIVAYLAGKGYPDVSHDLLTPTMYYAHSTHDDCPRYHYYSKHIFAQRFGDSEGCLFKLGCLGMLSYTECPRRQWNGGVNWCVRAAAPCIGCSHPQFGRSKAFPFYRKGEAEHGVHYSEADRQGVS